MSKNAWVYSSIYALVFWMAVSMAFGATVPTTGLVFTTNCASIANPVANQTLCFQTTTTGGRTAGQLYVYNGSAYAQISGSGAPVDATYITQTANSTLTNEQNLAALSTGLLKGTTGTGAVSIGAAGTDFAAATTGTANTPLFNNGSGGFTNGTRSGNTTAVVTTTGTQTANDCVTIDVNGNHVAAGGACTIGGGGITQLTSDVTAGPGTGSQAATIANAAVTLAKIANASANDKLLGSGNSGSGASYAEITLGSGLTMTGTTLSASGSGSSFVGYPFADYTQNATTGVTHTAGNFTVGHNFLALEAATITGVKFSYDGFASKTVKWTIYDTGYDNSGTSLLDTGTVAVSSAQVYTATFASPITFTRGKSYTIGLYINDGSNYIKINITVTPWASATTQVAIGPVAYRAIGANSAGDAQPTALNGTDAPPIQLIFQ